MRIWLQCNFCTAVACFSAGAAVSAAICGYVVSRKMRAYAELVGKPADLQDIHSKEHGNDAETAEASTAAPSKTQVLVSCPLSPRD